MRERFLLGFCLVATACLDASLDGDPPPVVDESADGTGFSSFLARVPRGGRAGTFVVEGDIVLRSEEELREYFNYYAHGTPSSLAVLRPPARGGNVTLSTVSSSEAADDVWDVAEKLDLTYCISDAFGGSKSKVRDALEIASNDWERATHVNFVYLPDHDGECAREQISVGIVTFTVEPSAGDFLASAFFPHYLWDDWRLLLSSEGLRQGVADLRGTMRHELGHILGLRHEHIRNPVICTKETTSGARDLTPFDSASVMHYDWCAGAAGANNELSAYDIVGIKQLYSLPTHHWTARFQGLPLSMQTDFNGDGRTDALFYRPLGTAGSVAAAGADDLSFPWWLTTNIEPFDSKPMAGHFTNTAGFTQDLLIYTPLDGEDVIESTVTPNFDFDGEPIDIDNIYQPLVGQFNNDFKTDIFWYQPGPGADTLWLSGEAGFSSIDKPNDGYYIPLVGDYGGDGLSDIVWYDPSAAMSRVWRITGNGEHFWFWVDHAAAGIPSGGGQYFPIQGDFNGDGRRDIFWYRPGSASDRLWLGGTASPAQQSIAQTVSGSYRPFTGDFNGDGRTDIFWYRPGSGSDAVWLFNGDGTHSSVTLHVTGDYAPFAGDFDGDGDDDIIWYEPQETFSPVWRADGNGQFTSLGKKHIPNRAFPVGYGGTY